MKARVPFLLCCIALTAVSAFHYDYTVMAPVGKRECFYQPISQGGVEVEFEYQVLDTSPINFQVKSPKGVLMISDIQRPSNIAMLKLPDAGIYEICILNRYTNEPRAVYVGLYSDAHDKHWPFASLDKMEESEDAAEQYMEIAVSEIKRYLDKIGQNYYKMMHLQQSIRTNNVKDYIVQRKNFTRVSNFSAIQAIVMILTSVVQVVTIRKLFGTNAVQARTNMKAAT